MAAPLTDGAKLYIPAVGEQMTGSGESSNSSSADDNTVLGAQTKTININTASDSDLETLSGVGPATAQKIIAGRPYHSAQELLDKKIVGTSVFGKIKEKVTVY